MADPVGGLEALRTLGEDGRSDPAAALALLYDLELEADDPADLDLYRSLALRTGGPVLELAAGTGRVAIPLAEAGHDVTAVDLDPAMLSRAADRARVAGVEERVTLVEADMLDLIGQPLPGAGRFRLAILALNSIFLLADRNAQADALRVMGAHLAPGGLAVVDVWLPSQADLEVYDGRLMLAALRLEPDGTSLAKTWSAVRDPDDRVVEVATWYDLAAPGGAIVRWVRRDPMRLVGAGELRAMAEDAGLEVELVAGDRELGPLGDDSERAVLVARRPGPV